MTMLPAVRPQSTGSTAPVIAEAASEARKPTALATSIGLDDAAERIPFAQLFENIGIAPRALVPDRRAHGAGTDDVGADAVAAIFRRERLGQADHAGLAGAIGGVAKRRQPVDRADVDDDAGPARLHRREHGVGAVIGAVEVALDEPAPVGRRR